VKPYFRAALSLILLLAPLPAASAVHRIALIVGNNEGSDTKPFLRYAEQDAKNLSRTLTQIGGFKSENVQLLLGKNPGTVLEKARTLASKAAHLSRNPQDQVLFLFYYSGHSEESLMEMGPSALDFRAMYDELKKIPATTRVVILDTCRSGRMVQSKGGVPIPPLSLPSERTQLPQGEVFITSSMPLEDSIESSEFQGSLFTHTFVSGLRGAADFDLDGRVSLNEALSFASQYTPLKAGAVQKRQHPTYEFNLSGTGEVYVTELMAGAPLLFLPPAEEGTFLVYERKSGVLVAEVPKKPGSPRYVALPPGDLKVRRDSAGFYQEQAIDADLWGLYYFRSEEAQKVRVNPSRRIHAPQVDGKAAAVVLREGEMIRLRLSERITSKTNQAGDQIRLESAEDVYVNNRPVIAAGAPARGEILALRKKRGIVHGELVCRLGYVRAVDGQWIPLEGMVSRSPAGLREVPEGSRADPLSSTGSETETDVASGLTAFFFLPFYPLFKGRDAVLEEGTLFEAFVARDVAIR
jgi:hypothetical protein